MDLYPGVLYRSANSAKVPFPSTKAEKHGDVVQAMLRRLEPGLPMHADPVRADTDRVSLERRHSARSVRAPASLLHRAARICLIVTCEIHERPSFRLELGWDWDAHEHAERVRWRRRIWRRDGPGPARRRPPALGRSEYWGRVKPRRGLRAHTSEAAPVCAARVPAPNL
jgi:hypothetical protein